MPDERLARYRAPVVALPQRSSSSLSSLDGASGQLEAGHGDTDADTPDNCLAGGDQKHQLHVQQQQRSRGKPLLGKVRKRA